MEEERRRIVEGHLLPVWFSTLGGVLWIETTSPVRSSTADDPSDEASLTVFVCVTCRDPASSSPLSRRPLVGWSLEVERLLPHSRPMRGGRIVPDVDGIEGAFHRTLTALVVLIADKLAETLQIRGFLCDFTHGKT